MKWEPIAAMLVLIALGFWVVWGPGAMHQTRPGAQLSKFQLAGTRGELEVVAAGDGTRSFRLLYRDGSATDVISDAEFQRIFGPAVYQRAVQDAGNVTFRALNVTGWGGVFWVAIGFAGQTLFFARMALQWVVSEKKRQSVVPESFWWLSLFGGLALFTYFAWRQDIVGVFGQTTGIVIYARNIRLIHKHRRRQARDAAGDPSGRDAATAADAARSANS